MVTLIMTASATMAGECGNLCNPNWWQTATQADIHTAIANGDAKARTVAGWIPLHLAAMLGTPESVTILLNAGADGSLKDEYGKTPFDLAIDNGKLNGSNAYWALNDARFR